MPVNQKCKFVSEVSSNHHQDIERCYQFIETSARIGCDAVKFQLFKIDELFAPEILSKSKAHSDRKQWELPESYIPLLSAHCKKHNIEFSCTPFYLAAVDVLAPYVDFFKIASYELLWDDLLIACAKTGLPVVISTGMANELEIVHAVNVLKKHGCVPTVLHCVSSYPTPEKECNLATIGYLKKLTACPTGWSDHSRRQNVIRRAVMHWEASFVEFHLDLEGQGSEYEAGHCWLPDEIEPVLSEFKQSDILDGKESINISASELSDRAWRADPSDGLRPLKATRKEF